MQILQIMIIFIVYYAIKVLCHVLGVKILLSVINITSFNLLLEIVVWQIAQLAIKFHDFFPKKFLINFNF